MARSREKTRARSQQYCVWDTAGFGGGPRVKELECIRGSFLAQIMYALFAAYVLMWAVLIFIC